jgi:8-oxo-dGTP diphosphatase
MGVVKWLVGALFSPPNPPNCTLRSEGKIGRGDLAPMTVYSLLPAQSGITNNEEPITHNSRMAYRNPAPTVDIIIELIDRPHRPIILIERRNEPLGWAIPGGFVDYGESVETAACREAKEEVGVDVALIEQFAVYSAPRRDPRQHTLSVVFLATATGEPKAADDAKNLGIFPAWELPSPLCFDHATILRDYWHYRHYQIRPRLLS